MTGEKKEETPHPVALTIAGSDSGGGAGIQADLKAFAACGVHGASVLTLVTAQNTQGVSGLEMLPEHLVRAQFEAVMGDLRPAAAKTGALGSEAVIGTVAEALSERPIDKLVVDPVIVSKHGDPLMPERAQRMIRDRMLEGAMLVTPNRHEAEALCGREVGNVASMKEAAKRIYDFGVQHVLIKGAHFDKIVRDIFFDGTGFIEFGADRIDSSRVHGSGCVYSAVITARLALEDELPEAIGFARDFISKAIENAPLVGRGIAPVNPMHEYWT
ncbi:bifunctional hydroxymethylpyrimidine kinase/phosphomethylpyrimidine kinase [Persicimonas caeni]|uniref:hydroxymethylpyrimidine kinase n=2 Tax=Persicimonas caeni TaxID=2292766 RepID=A0A4Y6Q353_PERCE|nr:bifunctional hydroxymethylpyrimidine kinase/phosphomethylpyrimidine kinase [Persicimonas caeni]QED36102.1 bifunctional hydroxymethylpyrimidine kinase/phosphomethylpyrimidine kinase [Persicimonas caeni]